MPHALRIEGLVKQYGGSPYRLGPIDLTLESGETLALLGQNGAGKSTLFQLITGNIDPTSGGIWIQGEKMALENFALKRRLGYLPQNLGLPRWVTGEEILSYAAALYELPDARREIEHQLDYWDCQTFRSRPLGLCSHGMQKRVGLGLSSLHDPDILILDEPFSGLDLYHIKNLKNLLLHRHKLGRTTILSTHIAPYAAELCQRAVVIKQGSINPIDKWLDISESERIAEVDRTFFGRS